MNRKGSHVGMVLSFVIFITFLVFLYSVIEPSLRTNDDKKSELEILEKNLLDRVSEDITIITVTGNESLKDSSNPDSCLEINFSEFKDLGNAFITEIDGRIIGGEIVEGGEKLKINWGAENVFKIYVSPRVNKVAGNIEGDCIEGVVEGAQKQKQIFNESLNNLSSEYYKDYDYLKSSLGVGANSNFGFEFGGRKIPEEVDIKQNIYVKEITLKVMNSTAHINSELFKIKAW